jgi:uncharacterized coiled-coil protein SlyX
MANEIKQKIVLEGEKEYSAALKNANRNLKTLRSELKAETAELGANATAQQKNETRAKSLQKQIAEQEKVVKTLTTALGEVREKYGDDEDAVARWEQRLNDARATLGNMRNELTNLGGSLDSVSQGMASAGATTAETVVATKSFADALGKVGDIGGTVSDKIETAMQSMLSKITEAVQAVYGSIVDLAARSNNMVDLAGYWNTDVATIQKYAGAVRAASGDLGDLNDLVTKINLTDSEKIAELTGVSDANYEDKWKYAMAVLDAINEMPAGDRMSITEQIFGKGSNKAKDILNDFSTLKDNLDVFDGENGGFGLKEEDIKKMSDLYDTINAIDEKWSRLKDSMMQKLFGDIVIQVSGNVNEILDALNEYMKAETQEEKDAAFKKIEDNIVKAFEAIKAGIEKGVELLNKLAEDLKESDNPTAQALGNILGGLVDALQWLTEDNMKNVIKALEIFIGFWAGARVMKIVGTIASLAGNLKTIQAFRGLSHLDGLGGGGGNTPTTSPTGGAVGDTAVKTGLGASLSTFANKVAGEVLKVSVQTGGLLPAVGDRFMNETNAGRALRDGGDVLEGLNQDITEKKAEVEQNASTFFDDWGNLFKTAWNNQVAFWNQTFYGNPYGPGGGNGGNAGGGDGFTGGGGSHGFGGEPTSLEELGIIDPVMTPEKWKEIVGGSSAEEIGKAVGEVLKQSDTGSQPDLQDLPSSWWRNQETQSQQTNSTLTGLNGTLSGLPGSVEGAIRNGMSGVRIYMDANEVGRLTAPYVDEYLGANAPVSFSP